MMIKQSIVLLLTLTISSIVADHFDEKVTARTLKDHFKELQRLEKNNKDFSYPKIETMKGKLEGLLTLSCNYELDDVNLTLSEIYQVFENQERTILQNAQEIKVMKEIVKSLAKLLPDTSKGKADIGFKSINKMEFKQQETLPKKFQLENSANRSQSVQTLQQTVRYSYKTIETRQTTTTRPTIKIFQNSSSLDNGLDLPEDVPDCQTPPLPSTYCHHYQILWYYSSKEGRCNRFRKGCEETFRNSYESERECRDICERPGFEEQKACFLPRSPGICKGVERKWYFDWRDNRCKDFIYKGCLGNQNRFPDEKTCRQRCGSINSKSAAEQGSKVDKSEYKRKQINKPINKDLDSKVSKSSANSEAHFADKDLDDNQTYEANKSIQATSAVKENDGHYPEYVPFQNQLFPPANEPTSALSNHKQLEIDKYVQTGLPGRKYMGHAPEYNPFNQAKSSHLDESRKEHSDRQKVQETNSIQSTLPYHEYDSPQTSENNERNDADNERIQIQSNHQKLESFKSSYDGPNYLDKIFISQQRTGQDYAPNLKNMNRKKTVFKGGYRNRKRKSRQYRYLYNDHHKRRSKVSKTQNLRVELHAPKDIEVGKHFKLKCIVSGSLAEAVDIIWDKDDSSHQTKGVEWKKKEQTNIHRFSNKKISTLSVPGIYSSVRFTCLVSCYDPQSARMLPTKLKEKEKVERVESYLCAFDSVKLKPNDGF